jgi:hypothetical protein
MPVRKRRDRRKSAVPEWRDEMDLEIGWLSDRTDEEMRALWDQHGDYILGNNPRAGMRPIAWWYFEHGIVSPGKPAEEAQALFEMGVMEADEIEQVRRDWRGLPEEMWPAFMRKM